MSSERQIEANRENAKKSTGPKSEHGKRRVSQNARRHGLTTPPNGDEVVTWTKVILDDPALDGINLSREGTSLVFSLAEAEARLDRIRETEFRFLEDYHALDRSAAHLERVYKTVEKHKRTVKQGPPFYYNGMKFAGLWEPDKATIEFYEYTRRKSYASELRRLFRYRREAECVRERALKAWIEYLSCLQDSKTKPSEENVGGAESETKPIPCGACFATQENADFLMDTNAKG